MGRADLRLTEHPILKFERGKPITFYYNGKKMIAYEGEPIAMALYANGVKILTRSLKYHRPRGMFCAIGKCSSCIMTVDGIPNVRTCIIPVREGMDVRSQNAWPSVEHDIYSILDHFDLSSDAYTRKFLRPRFLYNFYQKIIRKFTGHGKYPLGKAKRKEIPEKGPETIEADIVIIGGGPAGLSAALSAAKAGFSILIIDEGIRLGGQLVKQTHKFFGSAKHHAGVRGFIIAEQLTEELKKYDNIKVYLQSSVVGIFEGNILSVVREQREYFKVKAKKIIVATGAYERMLVFENNDLPGIMGAGGVQTVMNVYGIKPGNEAVIVGAGNVGLILAYQLLQVGVKVKAIVEAMPHIGGYFVHAAKIRRYGVPILTRHTVKKAIGKKHLEKVVIVKLNDKWQPIPGTEKEIKCDLLCINIGLKPSYELLKMAGCEMRYVKELGGFVALRNKYLETTVSGIYVAGDVSGIEEASTAIMEGRIAGISAALSLGVTDKKIEEELIKEREETMKDLAEFRSGPTSAKVVAGLKKVMIGEA